MPRENAVRSRCLASLNLAATPNSSSSSEGHDLAIFARVQDFFTRQEQFNALLEQKCSERLEKENQLPK